MADVIDISVKLSSRRKPNRVGCNSGASLVMRQFPQQLLQKYELAGALTQWYYRPAMVLPAQTALSSQDTR